MSENANIVANAIATFLVEQGALSTGDQLFAIRAEYARPWRSKLVRAGFDACYGMPVQDIAAGVDLALSRLLDEAQVEYDACALVPSSDNTLLWDVSRETMTGGGN